METQPTEVKREAMQNNARNQADAQMSDAAGSPAPRNAENEKVAAPPPQPPADKKTTISQDAQDTEDFARSARNTTPTTGNAAALSKEKSPKSRSVQPEDRRIGEKTFTRKNGVWYDANYNGQATTNILRGSDDYKKLDSGLRSIIGNLSGTVVIVWKNKAYRIQ